MGHGLFGGYPISRIEHMQQAIEKKYIDNEYGNILLAHPGFTPLLGLLIDGQIISSNNDICTIRNCFAEHAGLTGRAGKIFVIQKKKTIINWQTATDSGKDHKRKELSGKAVGLRYTWDNEKCEFVKRPGVEKLILLLDGTWSQKDIDALTNAGWEVYYPDEIDKLKKSIV